MTEITIEQIKPNPEQPRKHFDEAALQELADSIQEVGLLNPILVRPNGSGYEVVHGERRWRACQLAGLETIRADVRDLDDETAFLIAFTENLQRDDLNAMEEAQALQALKDKFGYSQAEVGARIGKSQPWISGRLALLKLPDEVQDQVITRVISPSAARELSRIDDPEIQANLADKAAKGNLTVRELESVPKETTTEPDWENWSLSEITAWCRREIGLDQYPPPEHPPDLSMSETIIWANQRLDYLNANPTGNAYFETFHRSVVNIHLHSASGSVLNRIDDCWGRKVKDYMTKEKGNFYKFFLLCSRLIANLEIGIDGESGEPVGITDVRDGLKYPEGCEILLEIGWIDENNQPLFQPDWDDLSYIQNNLYYLMQWLASRKTGEPLPRILSQY